MLKMAYETEEQREMLISQAISSGEYLIEDAILTNEKYLIFDAEPPKVEQQQPTAIELLQQENKLLKAQVQANADISDFHEELIVELAMMVYQ